jgi:hypothetical protein
MQRLMRDDRELRVARAERLDDEELEDIDEVAPGKHTLTEALAGPARRSLHELRRRLARPASVDRSAIPPSSESCTPVAPFDHQGRDPRKPPIG